MSDLHRHWSRNCTDEQLKNLLDLLKQLEAKGNAVPSAAAAIRKEAEYRGLK
jgi:hypothetical protein